MIKLIIILVLIFIAAFFGHTLIGQEGMVIIALPDTVIELNIISAAIILAAGIITLWILSWFIRRIIAITLGSKNWFGMYTRRQKNKAFHKGLHAYLIGDFSTALPLLQKSFGGEFSGTNYMLAADIDARIHDGKKVDALLTHAQVDEMSANTATLKLAQLTLMDDDAEKSLEVLGELSEQEQKQQIALQTKVQALAKLERWSEVKEIIHENKKALADDYITWAQRATHGEFAAIASKEGANALKDTWDDLPRSAKKDLGNQVCYVQTLLDQGMSSDAEEILVGFAKKQEHEAYWGLFKQLSHSTPTSAIAFIEGKIKKQPERSILYSVLAHLAYNSKDYTLAQQAVNKALELERTEQDLLLLAAVLEKDQSYEKANQLYRSLLD